jgi:potassium/hydrogen antiporter
VVVSVLVVAVAARWLAHLGWREALLLGAVLAPTDAAAVFSVLRKLPLPPRPSGMLEGESGLNDPPAVLAVTLLSSLGGHPPSPALIAVEIVYALVAGAAIGLVAGLASAFVLRRIELRLPAQANVALIVRGGKGFVPADTTALQVGDRLLIVATAAVREETERRLRAVGRAGKLAGWFGEHGR